MEVVDVEKEKELGRRLAVALYEALGSDRELVSGIAFVIKTAKGNFICGGGEHEGETFMKTLREGLDELCLSMAVNGKPDSIVVGPGGEVK